MYTFGNEKRGEIWKKYLKLEFGVGGKGWSGRIASCQGLEEGGCSKRYFLSFTNRHTISRLEYTCLDISSPFLISRSAELKALRSIYLDRYLDWVGERGKNDFFFYSFQSSVDIYIFSLWRIGTAERPPPKCFASCFGWIEASNMYDNEDAN